MGEKKPSYDWFPHRLWSWSNQQELYKEARLSEIEMYLVEKAHETKTKSIENSFQVYYFLSLILILIY